MNELENTGTQQADRFLKKSQVAQLLQVTTRTVDEWMRRRLVPYYRVGRTIRFREEDVVAHLRTTCRVQARGGIT
jgi:excisionase family DNA binding protein